MQISGSSTTHPVFGFSNLAISVSLFLCVFKGFAGRGAVQRWSYERSGSLADLLRPAPPHFAEVHELLRSSVHEKHSLILPDVFGKAKKFKVLPRWVVRADGIRSAGLWRSDPADQAPRDRDGPRRY